MNAGSGGTKVRTMLNFKPTFCLVIRRSFRRARGGYPGTGRGQNAVCPSLAAWAASDDDKFQVSNKGSKQGTRAVMDCT